MPRPDMPDLTPFEGVLPDINSPTTWSARTPPFWDWATGAGYENLTIQIAYNESVIDYVDSALAGSETLVDAVAALQALINNCIMKFRGSIASIPAGWQLCDGTNGTPDLRDKFIVGAGGAYDVGVTGGANTVTLSVGQLPSHPHSVNLNTNVAGDHAHQPSGGGTFLRQGAGGPIDGIGAGVNFGGGIQIVGSTSSNGAHAHNVNGNTGNTGSGEAHENRPPYYALAYIAKV